MNVDKFTRGKKMISYAPLAETLRKKGRSFSWLEDELHMEKGGLKWRMNEGRYISMGTLDRICGVLGCGVPDVIERREGEQRPAEIERSVSVDWEKFRADAGNLYEASERLGRSRTYLSVMSRKERAGRTLFRGICAALGLDASRYER